jgi:hypothetical protein
MFKRSLWEEVVMAAQTDVTEWCRLDLAEVIRGFIREREGLPVTALEADELADRLCDRVGLEVRMHLDRQEWWRQNSAAGPPRDGRTFDPAGPSAFADDPF